MSLTKFVLFKERYYPPTLRSRIEAGTRNVKEYNAKLRDENIARWEAILADGPLTRLQIEEKLNLKSVHATLCKMRWSGYIKEVGICRKTNNPSKLWGWVKQGEK